MRNVSQEFNEIRIITKKIYREKNTDRKLYFQEGLKDKTLKKERKKRKNQRKTKEGILECEKQPENLKEKIYIKEDF